MAAYMLLKVVLTALFSDSVEYPFETESWRALLFAGIGSIIGWLALESMIIGLRMSKSALASYAEQIGVIVPFCFDALALGRTFLKTD